MGIAVENQNLQMRRDLAGIKDPAQYEQARHQWFAQHPIINPLSGNPIIQDLEEQKRASASGNASNGPPIGTISGGYKFKGGNVKDKANWEKIP
jgi:hypothetical protein